MQRQVWQRPPDRISGEASEAQSARPQQYQATGGHSEVAVTLAGEGTLVEKPATTPTEATEIKILSLQNNAAECCNCVSSL